MAQPNPEELEIEDLATLVREGSFDIIPQTETAPGLAEGGTAAEASSDIAPSPESMDQPEPAIAESITDRRKKALTSRLQNMREAQDIRMEIA